MKDKDLLSWSVIEKHREGTFCYNPRRHLKTRKDAIRFVNERGFVFFWPISGFEVPSLWGAVAGNRPVPNNHDDPAHITWRWKDDLLGKGVWYYAKVLRQKSTMISLNLLPYFYSLSPNFGNPEEDYLITYQEGKLSLEEKQVYEALLDKGPLDSLALRKEARLSTKENAYRFSRALNLLMRDFRILPVGVAKAGTWNYAFVYDTVHRQFPDLIETAHPFSEPEGRACILETYFRSVGACKVSMIRKLFLWPEKLIERTLAFLTKSQIINHQVKFKDKEGEWWLLSALINS